MDIPIGHFKSHDWYVTSIICTSQHLIFIFLFQLTLDDHEAVKYTINHFLVMGALLGGSSHFVTGK